MTEEAKIMVHMNGPEIGEADNVLKSALDLHFKGKPWHFVLTENILKTQGNTVQEVLSHNSSLPFYRQFIHGNIMLSSSCLVFGWLTAIWLSRSHLAESQPFG